MWRLILLFIIAGAGFWSGKSAEVEKKSSALSQIAPEREFPLTEHKSFVFVLYAYNQAPWCQRALRSVFEQDYDHYRIIFIDDASIDPTEKVAKEFILNNNQDEKVLFIHNETCLGPVASLYRVIDHCLDREIIIPLDAKDWLASQGVLNRLNLAYQNPDVWLASGWSIEYPAYRIREEGPIFYYAALFKQLRLHHLFEKGHFSMSHKAYLSPLIDLAGGRFRKLQEPIAFINLAPPQRSEEPATLSTRLTPLKTFPEPEGPKRGDIVLFSFDRPLQLYACLESIQRYMAGFEELTVLYGASSEPFAAAYEQVKEAFPAIYFARQEGDDLKRQLKQIAFSSDYLLLGTDRLIVKDFVDLGRCMDQMEKTGAYGFYLGLGRHIQSLPPSHPLSSGIYAWDLDMGEADWDVAFSFDLTVYKKEAVETALVHSKFKNLKEFEQSLAKEMPDRSIGLYFEHSKLVNVPNTNGLKEEELLVKFNQGLKIDIEPLYKMENSSLSIDYIPEFVMR